LKIIEKRWNVLCDVHQKRATRIMRADILHHRKHKLFAEKLLQCQIYILYATQSYFNAI